MVMTLKADVLVDGAAEGDLVLLQKPICFWGGLDARTGRITDPKHPDFGVAVTGKILAVPEIVGSSSSSQLLLEALRLKTAPAAILLGQADAIIAMAVLVGQAMDFGTIPILHANLATLQPGDLLDIRPQGHIKKLVAI